MSVIWCPFLVCYTMPVLYFDVCGLFDMSVSFVFYILMYLVCLIWVVSTTVMCQTSHARFQPMASSVLNRGLFTRLYWEPTRQSWLKWNQVRQDIRLSSRYHPQMCVAGCYFVYKYKIYSKIFKCGPHFLYPPPKAKIMDTGFSHLIFHNWLVYSGYSVSKIIN